MKENYQGKRTGKPGKRMEPRSGRKRLLTKTEKWLIAIAAVLAVALIGVIAWKLLFVKPELGEDPKTETLDYGEGIRPRADGERKSEDYYTVLILGRDTGGGGNTDTILLASYDVTNQKATVMSIPRDTMVNVSWDIKRINSVYNVNGGGEKGIKALYREISQLVGFEPDYQVVVEWEAVGEIVNAMGGVYFDVPRDMDYEDPYQDLSIHLKSGYQKLSGEDAMGVIRWRHDNHGNGYAEGDIGRIRTQQAFLKEMIKQLLQLKNITKVREFVRVFQRNVETDLSFQNILWFAQSAYLGGLSVDDVEFVTMPNTPTYCWSRGYHNYQSYVVPKAEELLELVNGKLSPFTERFGMSDLDIMSVNADGSISSSTGHVEDAKAAQSQSHSTGGHETVGTADDPTGTGEGGTEPDPQLPEDPGPADPPTEPGEEGSGEPAEPTPEDPTPADPQPTEPEIPAEGGGE